LHGISYNYFDAVSLGNKIPGWGSPARVGGINRIELAPRRSTPSKSKVEGPPCRGPPAGVENSGRLRGALWPITLGPGTVAWRHPTLPRVGCCEVCGTAVPRTATRTAGRRTTVCHAKLNARWGMGAGDDSEERYMATRWSQCWAGRYSGHAVPPCIDHGLPRFGRPASVARRSARMVHPVGV
jgi:hypothetical protein